MRFVGILFFVLLAAQLVIRYARPTPAPPWSRVAVIACCVGVIVCLLIPPIVERVQRGKGDGKSDSPAE